MSQRRQPFSKMEDAENSSFSSISHSLSPGRTDSQVVASSRKLNLCKDLCWVAKPIRKFPPKYSRQKWVGLRPTYITVAAKMIAILKTLQIYPVFHWLIGCFNNEWMPLNLR